MQQFLRDEPSYYFDLRVHLIAQMQTYFHATWRLQYAKSSQVYLQTMEDQEGKMSSEDFKKFSENPYFTCIFRCTSKIWSGILCEALGELACTHCETSHHQLKMIICRLETTKK